MKKIFTSVIFFTFFLFRLSAQNLQYHEVYTSGPINERTGFYGIADEPTECISEAEGAIIQTRIDENTRLLQSKGVLNVSRGVPNPLFAWPLQFASGYNDYCYYAFVQYVNHDTTNPNTPLDYNCGNVSYYNTASSSYHRGTDIGLWPFKWLRLDSSYVQVIAAAQGVIVHKTDGNFDHSCAFNTNTWNAIYLQHFDGSVTWYGHMKSGSLTSKIVGDTVQTGEYLGTVGSSGNSSGPHLHFEVHDASGNLIDPFAGPCNNLNATSWWLNQKPYLESGVNRVATNTHQPVFSACPTEEVTNESDYFNLGDTVYCLNYFRALDSMDTARIHIYRPSGSLYRNLLFTNAGPFYKEAWSWNWHIIAVTDSVGQWRYDLIYKGQTYTHYFYENAVTGINDINLSSTGFGLYPNPARDEITVERIEATIPANISIINTLGQMVYRQSVNTEEKHIEVQLSNLPPGSYRVILSSPAGIASKTLIRQ